MMKKEDIKKVLEEFVQEDGTIDLDGASEALEKLLAESGAESPRKEDDAEAMIKAMVSDLKGGK